MRTYEPFKFLGRFFVLPLHIRQGTPWVSLTQTWETEPPYRFAHTVVIKAAVLPFGVGLGWWLDTDVDNLEDEFMQNVESALGNSAYDAYVAVNGNVDRAQWDAARKRVAGQGLDLDDEMEVMQSLGIFGDMA